MKCITYCLAMALLLIGISIGCIRIYLQHVRHTRSLEIQAEVIKSEVKYHKKTYSRRGGGSKGGYYPSITFKYNVNGVTYESNWFYPWANGMRLMDCKMDAEEFIKNYSSGKKINAYYRSDKPEEAFLFKNKYFSAENIAFTSAIICIITYLYMGGIKMNGTIIKHESFLHFSLCIYWLIAGAVCYVYHFNFIDKPYSNWLILRGTIYFLLGFVWLYYTLKPVVFGNPKVHPN